MLSTSLYALSYTSLSGCGWEDVSCKFRLVTKPEKSLILQIMCNTKCFHGSTALHSIQYTLEVTNSVCVTFRICTALHVLV